MITKLIRACVLALVLCLLYWLVSITVVAVGAPPVVLTISLVILILCFIGWLLREFGITGPFIILALCSFVAGIVDAGPEPQPSAALPPWVDELAGNIFSARAVSVAVSPSIHGHDVGANISVLYPVSEYAFAGIRIDVLNHNFTAPSAIVGAKYTLQNVPLKPTVFTVGGLIMAIGGAGEENHVVGATTGIGASAVLWHSGDGRFGLSAFIEAEKWTNFTEPVYHPGLVFSGRF